jgi:hypothetical protein
VILRVADPPTGERAPPKSTAAAASANPKNIIVMKVSLLHHECTVKASVSR